MGRRDGVCQANRDHSTSAGHDQPTHASTTSTKPVALQKPHPDRRVGDQIAAHPKCDPRAMYVSSASVVHSLFASTRRYAHARPWYPHPAQAACTALSKGTSPCDPLVLPPMAPPPALKAFLFICPGAQPNDHLLSSKHVYKPGRRVGGYRLRLAEPDRRRSDFRPRA